jgi:hypothetical protein
MLLGLCAVLACRIEDHTPGGTRRDEALVRDAVTAFFRSLNARDWRGMRALFSDRASVDVVTGTGEATLSPDSFAALLARSRDRGDIPSARMLRTDFRQIGDLAGAWVVYRNGETGAQLMVDHFLFRRGYSGWRIIHLSSSALPQGVEP